MSYEIIKDCLEYIEEHIEFVEPEDVVMRSHYSKYHFYRMFSDWKGISLKQYITTRKLAYIFYEANNKPLLDCAYAYGFDTYSGFYKACNKAYGMSPKAYQSHVHHSKPVLSIVKEKYPMITEQRLRGLLKHWQLEDLPVSNIYSENGQKRKDLFKIGEGYQFYVYHSEERLKNSYKLQEALKEQGIDTPSFIQTKDDNYYVHDGQYYAVKECYDFDTYDCQTILENDQVAYKLGAAVGKFHLACEGIDQELTDETNVYDTCIHWAIPAIPYDDDFMTEFKETYAKFERPSKEIPTQIIHRNMHLFNILFEDDVLRGYGDLHLTIKNVRMFDLAYLCTSILAEPMSDKDMWLNTVEKIMDGYHEVNPMYEQEFKSFKYVMYSMQLIFIAYFLSKSNYEDLARKNYELLKWMYKSFEKK